MSQEHFFNAAYQRLQTLPVEVGNCVIGGNSPIVLQSMTNTSTLDTRATVEQTLRMVNAGSQMVRITAPGVREADNLREIKKALRIRGCEVPLIADIHFQPKAAEIAARYVEKVRINPGNYTDRNLPGRIEFSEEEYNDELSRIRERLAPLVRICKENGTAIRVGSNHGSLSQRIMSRYGNTPLGMAVSAIEFIEAFEALGFYKTVISMKASNPRVMVHSVRLMVTMMQERGRVYPLHLGVTEAGAGRSGRIKSAAGIAALLEDGIGDTIRVSLTEPPENELPVANRLVQKYAFPDLTGPVPKVILPVGYIDYSGRMQGLSDELVLAIPPEQLPNEIHWYSVTPESFQREILQQMPSNVPVGILLDLTDSSFLAPGRRIFEAVHASGRKIPVLLKKEFGKASPEELFVEAGRDFGFFLLDGLGDGIVATSDVLQRDELAEVLLEVLQASRARISKAEFVACPSCGRTRFDIAKALHDVQRATQHLTGLTIGVMGCIVNGPGEMADADFGYVGAGNGKVALFKGSTMVENNVPEENAVEKLVQLIKNSGRWIDP
ncbi:MAG: (E)-4-hydroxy-3-methylbut-2-enyl-diphosphate synthase [Bacteroidales bacterium]|nr:(E)-4-hydroxy-3-methylbut-2-enyl-diphosphate synthase [Bacteroidales bacterium]MDD2322054.1 (E)-4-hydroxy-3-methylbut-2-enyl-diphosphate synthase [Bacteroidales bacterium]MDD3009724.1 (E)-4-hydroxy-3-methylbut-2-enyl-diphosphate synthase [Bacteroidales bacterium]MDD3960681.1 (E)-4-hydroxy-3-methylbut-2-enyl-diphosphate synthase [Bacteroidales bacterium]MDY0285003.1 (E)-4-hydroxy-3-methylbut-2-enyl-diphosphate synthase [Bacteroidales bacterium]